MEPHKFDRMECRPAKPRAQEQGPGAFRYRTVSQGTTEDLDGAREGMLHEWVGAIGLTRVNSTLLVKLPLARTV